MRAAPTFLTVTLLASFSLLADEPPLNGWPQYPGLTPDCWPDVRMVHYVGEQGGSAWEQFTKTQKAVLPAGQAPGGAYGAEPVPVPEGAVMSSNDGYWFVLEHKDEDRRSLLRIYAEKRHFHEITIEDIRDPPQVRWINEKLLFIRVMWGRVAGTDLILDVETEQIVYEGTVNLAVVDWQQFHGDCPIMEGCPCIQKRTDP